jgi:hypothetical protein
MRRSRNRHLFHRSSTTCKHLIDRIGYGTVVIHIERATVPGSPSAEAIFRSDPALLAEFCDEYTRHLIRLRTEKNGSLVAARAS